MGFLSKQEVAHYLEAKELIRSSSKLLPHHKIAMEKVADHAVSVSLRNPAVSDLVREVQIHRHTKKACKKYKTECRFNFPKLPTRKTIISAPSNVTFDSEKEKTEKMTRYSNVISE